MTLWLSESSKWRRLAERELYIVCAFGWEWRQYCSQSTTKIVLLVFFEQYNDIIHKKFYQQGFALAALFYRDDIEWLLKCTHHVQLQYLENNDWMLLHNSVPGHLAIIVKQFVSVFHHPLYSPVLAPVDYFSFLKVKFLLWKKKKQLKLPLHRS